MTASWPCQLAMAVAVFETRLPTDLMAFGTSLQIDVGASERPGRALRAEVGGQGVGARVEGHRDICDGRVGRQHLAAVAVEQREVANESEVLAHGGGGLGLVRLAAERVVVGVHLQLAPVHAALRVDVVEIGLDAVGRSLEEARHGPERIEMFPTVTEFDVMPTVESASAVVTGGGSRTEGQWY